MKNYHEVSGRGQSLVEIAIVMPIILLLIGGLAEISNLLIAQNRVATGTRAATSFGTTNFREEALPSGWADSMAGVALNSVLNTPQADSELWEFAVVRAKTNASGDGFERWNIEYPNGTSSADMPSEEALQAQVLSKLGDSASAGGLDLLITVAHTQYESLLNLDALFDAYPSTLTAINVGLVDRDEEPEIVCLQGSETGRPSILRVQHAIDITGAHIDPPVRETIPYLTSRWSGGQQQVQYMAGRIGAGMSFSGSNLGQNNVVETDRFVMVVAGTPTQVGVRISSSIDPHLVIVDLQPGVTKTKYGFTTHVVDVVSGEENSTITLELSSDGSGTSRLDRVVFKFLGSTSTCTEWGTPDEMGSYSTVGPDEERLGDYSGTLRP